MSITASAVLVELNISVWTARKLDKKVSEEINVANASYPDWPEDPARGALIVGKIPG